MFVIYAGWLKFGQLWNWVTFCIRRRSNRILIRAIARLSAFLALSILRLRFHRLTAFSILLIRKLFLRLRWSSRTAWIMALSSRLFILRVRMYRVTKEATSLMTKQMLRIHSCIENVFGFFYITGSLFKKCSIR